MRKLGLSLFSCIALVAFMGLSAPAFALYDAVDPSCDLDNPSWGDGIPGPYDNDAEINDFVIQMTDTYVEHEVSGLTGGGLACGTHVYWYYAGQETIYDHADIRVPRGVEIGETSWIANGRFVGFARVNVATHFLGAGAIVGPGYDPPGVPSVLTIDSIASCEAESPRGGDIPGAIVACYRGDNPVGHNYNWVTAGSDGNTWLTIGPFHSSLTPVAGLTHIHEFSLCGYVGAQGGSVFPDDCGTSSDPFLQKNGDAPSGGPGGQPCAGGAEGVYTATATQRGTGPEGGTTTPKASTCVPWVAAKPPQPTPQPSTGNRPGPSAPSPGTGNH